MKNFSNILKAIAFVVLVTGLCYGQSAMTSTTLAAAVTQSQQYVTVASATGVLSPGSLNQPLTMLYIDGEFMSVTAVSGTRVSVRRAGQGGPVTAHPSGATVWFGPPSYFGASNKVSGSSCTSTNYAVLPIIVPSTGKAWTCTGSVWAEFNLQNIGTAAAGVTVAEFGNATHHRTKLTFTDLAMAATTNASLAMGKLLYTLPAGAVVVKSSYMSTALDNAGGLDDADTPDVGLGTTVGSGVNALLSAVGATAENIMTGQTATDTNATATVAAVGTILAVAPAGDHTVYLNVADGWAGISSGITATGTVVIEWVYLGS